AASLVVNSNADPEQSGDLWRLRDGGIGDPTAPGYVYNSMGASAFAERLQALADGFDRKQVFDPSLGTPENADLGSLASASAGWLEAARQKAAADIDYREALLARSTQAL